MSARIGVAGIAVVAALTASVIASPLAVAGTLRTRLPVDAPAALYRSEPGLPMAKGWPASNTAFSPTSGTGRLADGAMYWTDWLYDDHGTTTASTGGTAVAAGTPTFGTYVYPAGAAHSNGADIFRAAVALRRAASYWRVDWTTLAKATVPIAEWTFDRDNNTSTGTSAWPANADVSSPGIDTALVVSSRGARLIDAATGAVTARLHTIVDLAAHSFVVRIPHRTLDPQGTWRIRLAAGLANGAGTGFAPAPDAAAGQTRVYNVTFRSIHQEPVADDFWDDEAQTRALATGDVSQFSYLLRWSRLRRRVTTHPPLIRGWSDRWYVSDVDLGEGLIDTAASTADGEPNYLGRVQPYAVYVPTSYRPGRPAPLTLMLHSSNQNHNQYAATTPAFVREACEDRHAICVSPLGRGPDGNYWDYAELDFWQVWHQVATAFDIEPHHTIITGYSMGGIGANQLAMAHPDLFARSVTLAGGVGDVDSLHNLRWVPTYLAGAAEDELVPVTLEKAEADTLSALGDRFRWIVESALDHVSYELADSFADAVRYMGHARVVTDPGRFSFTWTPSNTPPPDGTSVAATAGIGWTQLPRLGVGTTGDYWVRHLEARSTARDATVLASSGERPARSVHPIRSRQADPTFQPEPALVTSLRWTRGPRQARRPLLTLALRNVRSLRVLLHGAGFHSGTRGRLVVRTDGRTTIRLGRHAYHFSAGRHVAHFGS